MMRSSKNLKSAIFKKFRKLSTPFKKIYLNIKWDTTYDIINYILFYKFFLKISAISTNDPVGKWKLLWNVSLYIFYER